MNIRQGKQAVNGLLLFTATMLIGLWCGQLTFAADKEILAWREYAEDPEVTGNARGDGLWGNGIWPALDIDDGMPIGLHIDGGLMTLEAGTSATATAIGHDGVEFEGEISESSDPRFIVHVDFDGDVEVSASQSQPNSNSYSAFAYLGFCVKKWYDGAPAGESIQDTSASIVNESTADADSITDDYDLTTLGYTRVKLQIRLAGSVDLQTSRGEVVVYGETKETDGVSGTIKLWDYGVNPPIQ